MEVTLIRSIVGIFGVVANYVSILVLMEVTLIHNCKNLFGHEECCFNPCFNGSYSYTDFIIV